MRTTLKRIMKIAAVVSLLSTGAGCGSLRGASGWRAWNPELQASSYTEVAHVEGGLMWDLKW